MKAQLHITSLQILSKCGEQFRRRYIEKEVRPPGVAPLVGTATHKSIARNLTAKIETGSLLPVDAVTEEARDALAKGWEAGVEFDDEEREQGEQAVRAGAIDKAVRLARLHHSALAPKIAATHVERSFCLALPGYPVDLAGTLDIQEGAACVRDSKTASKSPPQNAAEQSEQLTAYALAVQALDGSPPERVALDYLVDLKTGPKTVTLESRRGPDDFGPLLRRIETAGEAIEKGVFVPARPDDWWCSKQWCGYWSTCRYVRRPTTVALSVNGKETTNG